MTTLIDRLRATRADYEEECKWHRFLLDAICGTGGFRGRVGPTTVSYLGWAAEAYSAYNSITLTSAQLAARSGADSDSYLDRFPREDQPKFGARRTVAQYLNYTGPILSTILAYINKEEMNFDGVSDAVQTWQEDVDGKGTPWDVMMRETVRRRAGGLGWCPVLLDQARPDADDAAELSVAATREMGVRINAIPLYPVNLLDWQVDDDGDLIAAKIRTSYQTRVDLLSQAETHEVYSLWYRDRVDRYEIVRQADGKEDLVSATPETVNHGFGFVPLVVFRGNPADGDTVRGHSIIGDTAAVNRRIFNIDSEWDDFLRNSCFPMLQIPVSDMANVATILGEIIGGNGSAIAIPADSKQGLAAVAPPESVPTAIKDRRDVLVHELYRTARVEYARQNGVTTSGIARAYEFEQTNRMLGEIAQSFARSEQEALRMFERMGGAKDSALTVTAPADFSVEDMATDIANVVGLKDLGVGPTAETELKRRAVKRALPNLPSETEATIDQELDDLKVQSAQNDALAQEVETAKQQTMLDNGGVAPVAAPGQGGL